MILIALTAAAVTATAVAVVLITVVVSVRGEDRHGELPHHAPTLITRCVRRLTGLRICQPGETVLDQTPFRQKAASRVDRADPASSPPKVTGEPSSAEPGNRRSA